VEATATGVGGSLGSSEHLALRVLGVLVLVSTSGRFKIEQLFGADEADTVGRVRESVAGLRFAPGSGIAHAGHWL
jgi:hypothetical protein